MPALDDSAAVVVWGGGTGGVAAALQAARAGAQTLLLTPGSWLGGMVSAAGVCCPDGNELSPWQTGLWGALLRTLEQAESEGLDQNWVSCFGYRPSTAEAILQAWVAAEPHLRWLPSCELLEVERQGSLIRALVIEQGSERIRIACQVVIDGSDRGDLLPLAGAPYRLGWEPQELWGEPSAPSQSRLSSEVFFQDHPVQSPTWVVMGQWRPEHQDGAPSGATLPAPFERACEAFGLERTITYGRLPGGLVMLNWPLDGNDWHWGLQRAFSGRAQDEATLYSEMQAHSLRFAAALEAATGGQLQLAEAFPAQAGAPAPWLAAMPYWREGRRLVGRHTVIEQELLPRSTGQSIAPLPLNGSGLSESIAVGNYANDHHYPGPDWPLAPKSCRWGGRWSGTPFCVPYGALISAEIDNLLAADKAFSTSHMANGATRLQPLILNVGQAAGAAAALAVESERSPAELPVRAVQQRLIEDPVAPSAVVPLWDTAWHHPHWRERQNQALEDPSRLGPDGRWQGPLLRSLPPRSAHELQLSGMLEPGADGSYQLRLDQALMGRNCWPLITLEPELHHHLLELDRSTRVQLRGFCNPWGPWIRASALAGGSDQP
ncbi:MAG: FAD-dependent oxidoreductase [Vulcanococcus sp.]